MAIVLAMAVAKVPMAAAMANAMALVLAQGPWPVVWPQIWSRTQPQTIAMDKAIATAKEIHHICCDPLRRRISASQSHVRFRRKL